MNCALNTLAPSRRQLLASIGFVYQPWGSDTKVAGEVFSILAEPPRLRSLRIMIDEGKWTAATKARSSDDRKYPDLMKLPGFSILKTVRSKEVIFYRTNTAVAEMLRAAILRPKTEVAANKGKVKRSTRSSRATDS